MLRERLPAAWTLDLRPEPGRGADRGIDAVLEIAAPDGRAARLIVGAKQRLDPRRAGEMVSKFQRLAGNQPSLAVAPWLSSSTRAQFQNAAINIVDLTGNVMIALSEPGLFIETTGAERDPWPEKSTASLRGAKAARVVRVLGRAKPPIGVRELAARAGTTPGYVSKLLAMLHDQGGVTRTERGQVAAVNRRRVIEQWAEDSPLSERTRSTSWIAARGLTAFLARLAAASDRYALTGSLAAARRAPVAEPRVASVYMDDPDMAGSALELRPATAGANVVLLVPSDDVVFEETWEEKGVRYADLVQVAADLLSGPGRDPAEGAALLAWMDQNEEAWRG